MMNGDEFVNLILGGALKETDTGLWVHLVCALYVPGIAFGELDKLTQVCIH